ncbi:MAG: 50S ribosomal protein L30e [Candidatus Heimdallarchaeota archaeon]
MKQDLEKAIGMVISTGKVKLGFKAVLDSVLNGKIKTVVTSNNLPQNSKIRLLRSCQLSNIPIIDVDRTGKELGAICGRPHKISVLAVIDPGKSKIMEYFD